VIIRHQNDDWWLSTVNDGQLCALSAPVRLLIEAVNSAHWKTLKRVEASGTQRDRDGPARFAAGLADYHDPTAGFAGAPPALSALTLRLVLAIFGLVTASGGAVLTIEVGGPIAFSVVLGLIAVTAGIDIAVIVRRKRRGEPG
jgi:hypothetical protein